MNKFEQVSRGPCTEEVGPGGGGLYDKVQCITCNGHMGPPPPVDRLTDGQTRLKTLPSCNFFGGR